MKIFTILIIGLIAVDEDNTKKATVDATEGVNVDKVLETTKTYLDNELRDEIETSSREFLRGYFTVVEGDDQDKAD